MNIVKMQEEHAKIIAQLEKQCFSEPWSEKSLTEECENPQAVFLVAEKDGVILGYAGMHVACGEGYVDNVAVFKDYRRMGVGRALVTELTKHTREFITLEVRESNAAAISLYMSLGFKKVGIRKGFYTAPYENGLILTKMAGA